MLRKNDYLALRLSSDEKSKFEKEAKRKGYWSVSEWVLNVLRKYFKSADRKG